jgi:hypothetical protein
MDIEEYHYTISKDLGTGWAGWQEGHLDDVLPFHNSTAINHVTM